MMKKYSIVSLAAVAGIFAWGSIVSDVDAANTSTIRWPKHMVVQEGSSQSIISTGIAQTLESGMQQIGFEVIKSYMILDKSGNNYYYARYGEGTLLYGFGPEAADSAHPFPTGEHMGEQMVQDYQTYMESHPELFTIVTPLHVEGNRRYRGEVIVNSWYKQAEYPLYMQVVFTVESSHPPRVQYVLTSVDDIHMREKLQSILK